MPLVWPVALADVTSATWLYEHVSTDTNDRNIMSVKCNDKALSSMSRFQIEGTHQKTGSSDQGKVTSVPNCGPETVVVRLGAGKYAVGISKR